MEMSKDTIIKSVEMSFKKHLALEQSKSINPKIAEELLRHTVQMIEQNNYTQGVDIARRAISTLMQLKGRKRKLTL